MHKYPRHLDAMLLASACPRREGILQGPDLEGLTALLGDSIPIVIKGANLAILPITVQIIKSTMIQGRLSVEGICALQAAQ